MTRESRPIVVSLLAIAVAHAADRLVRAAAESYGTLPEAGNAAKLAAVDSVGTLSIVAVIATLAWLVFRQPISRLSALVLLTIGMYFTVVIALPLLTRGAIDPPFGLDAYLGAAHFVRWTGTAVGAVGLVALLAPRLRHRAPEPTKDAGWIAVGALVLLLVVGFVFIEPLMAAVLVGWSANLEAVPYLVVDVLVRIAFVTALLGVALGARRADEPGPGVVMVAIGLVGAILFLVTGQSTTPRMGSPVLWVSGAAVAIGLWRLLTREPSSKLGEAVVT